MNSYIVSKLHAQIHTNYFLIRAATRLFSPLLPRQEHVSYWITFRFRRYPVYRSWWSGYRKSPSGTNVWVAYVHKLFERTLSVLGILFPAFLGPAYRIQSTVIRFIIYFTCLSHYTCCRNQTIHTFAITTQAIYLLPIYVCK